MAYPPAPCDSSHLDLSGVCLCPPCPYYQDKVLPAFGQPHPPAASEQSSTPRRDFGDWQRKGPLPPPTWSSPRIRLEDLLPPQEPSASDVKEMPAAFLRNSISAEQNSQVQTPALLDIDPVPQHPPGLRENLVRMPPPSSPKSPLVCYTPEATPIASITNRCDLSSFNTDSTFSPAYPQHPPSPAPATQEPPVHRVVVCDGISFKDLLPFITKLLQRCKSEQKQETFTRFLEILGRFGNGEKTFDFTCGHVSELLKWAPDLVKEFEQLKREVYGEAVENERYNRFSWSQSSIKSGESGTSSWVSSQVKEAASEGESHGTPSFFIDEHWGGDDLAEAHSSWGGCVSPLPAGWKNMQPSCATDDGAQSPESPLCSGCGCYLEISSSCGWCAQGGGECQEPMPDSSSTSESLSEPDMTYEHMIDQWNALQNIKLDASSPGQGEIEFLRCRIKNANLGSNDHYKVLGILSTLPVSNSPPPGQNEVDLLRRSVENAHFGSMDTDNRYKALGILGTLLGGKIPLNCPSDNTQSPNSATPSDDGTREALHRIEVKLAVIQAQHLASSKSSSATPIPDAKGGAKGGAMYDDFEELRSRVDYLYTNAGCLGNGIERLSDRLEKVEDSRQELIEDVADCHKRSWNIEGQMDGLTSKVDAAVSRVAPAASSDTRQMIAWLDWLYQNVNGLDNRLTGALNAHSKLDHAQNEKLESLSRGLAAVERDVDRMRDDFEDYAIDPIVAMKSQLRRQDGRLDGLVQAIESGDVDERFVDAELQLEEMREKIKTLSEAQDSNSIQDIKAELKTLADGQSSLVAAMGSSAAHIQSLNSRLGNGDPCQRFTDTDRELADMRVKIKALSDAKNNTSNEDLEAIRAELKTLAETQASRDADTIPAFSPQMIKYDEQLKCLLQWAGKVDTFKAQSSKDVKYVKIKLRDLTTTCESLKVQMPETSTTLRLVEDSLKNNNILPRLLHAELGLDDIKKQIKDASNVGLRTAGPSVLAQVKDLADKCFAVEADVNETSERLASMQRSITASEMDVDKRLVDCEVQLEAVQDKVQNALYESPTSTTALLLAKETKQRLATMQRSITSSGVNVDKRLVDHEMQLHALETKVQKLDSEPASEEPEVCDYCKQVGHQAKDCDDGPDGDCRVCGFRGHFARDCPHKPQSSCYTCGGLGHDASDCPEDTCYSCGQDDHHSSKCPVGRQCSNCDEFGHDGGSCPKPTDWSRVECSSCFTTGHPSVRCPNPETGW